MIQPEDVDSEGYLSRLSDYDESNFREEYEETFQDLSYDASKTAVEALLRNKHEPRYEVLKAVADAFHPYNEHGRKTEFEVALTNPLCEISKTPADLLLTAHDYREVHLCFVVCEAGGENYIEWARNVNQVYNLYKGHEEELLIQIPIEGLETGKVQFVTATHKEDLPDIDFKYMNSSVSADNYSLWVVDDDNESDEERQVELREEYGTITHGKLRERLEKGLDYGKGGDTEVGCTLNSHDFIVLRETFMGLMFRQHTDNRDEPREFDQRDFVNELTEQTQVDEPPDEKLDVIQARAKNLLRVADNAEMVFSGSNSRINTNRDYRLRYPSGLFTQVPEHIEPKYVEYRTPLKRGEDAFQQVKDGFEPRYQLKSEIDDSDSWGTD